MGVRESVALAPGKKLEVESENRLKTHRPNFKRCHPVVCKRLMGRVLQSVTQLSVSNRWYVLDQHN